MLHPKARAEAVKAKALALGFDVCGVAEAGPIDPEDRLGKWLADGFHADMAWLANTKELRQDVHLKLPGARSVVVVARNYWNPRPPESKTSGRVARYAWGRDYHRVLRRPLRALADFIGGLSPDATQYCCIDSGPVLERAWAAKAGIGWIGKNSLLLRREGGSWCFLAVILTTVELVPDAPIPDHCGSCTACLEACPTQAITAPGIVDSRRCISYHTIENRGAIPGEIAGNMEDWVFGCDICQDICPWSRFTTPSDDPDFQPKEGHAHPELATLVKMDEETFRRLFSGTPILRAKLAGIQRNARIAQENLAKPLPTRDRQAEGPACAKEQPSKSR